jgi:hypothetical protein
MGPVNQRLEEIANRLVRLRTIKNVSNEKVKVRSW